MLHLPCCSSYPVSDVEHPRAGSSPHTLLHCLGISPTVSIHHSTHCNPSPLHHVQTPSSMQAYCTHTCSLHHFLILTFEPLLFSGHSCVSTPVKAAPWGAVERRTQPLQESSPSYEAARKTIQCSSPSNASLCTQLKSTLGRLGREGDPGSPPPGPGTQMCSPRLAQICTLMPGLSCSCSRCKTQQQR